MRSIKAQELTIDQLAGCAVVAVYSGDDQYETIVDNISAKIRKASDRLIVHSSNVHVEIKLRNVMRYFFEDTKAYFKLKNNALVVLTIKQ